MLGQNLDEECLPQIVSVFLAGLVADAEDFGHIFIIDLLTCAVDKMTRNLPESPYVTDFVASLDVFLQNGVDKALNITSLVLNRWSSGKPPCKPSQYQKGVTKLCTRAVPGVNMC